MWFQLQNLYIIQEKLNICSLSMIQSLVRCNLPDHLLFWHRIKGRPIDPIKLFTLFVFTRFPAKMLRGADSNSLTAERSPSHSTGGITAGVSGRFINTWRAASETTITHIRAEPKGSAQQQPVRWFSCRPPARRGVFFGCSQATWPRALIISAEALKWISFN